MVYISLRIANDYLLNQPKSAKRGFEFGLGSHDGPFSNEIQ